MGNIKIVTDSSELKNALERHLKFSPLEIGDRDLILVDVNCFLKSSQSRVNRDGLGLAWEYAENSQNVVILLGLEPEWYLRQTSTDFVGLMTRANVDFSDIIILDQVLPKYQAIISGQKQENSTGLAVYEFQKKQKAIASLRHCIRQVDDSNSRKSWLEEARAAGISGTDEEIIAYVRAWEPDTAGEFVGKKLSGIFVDAYQTLFDEEWKLDAKVKAAVEKLAAEQEKQVFVISDSSASPLQHLLDFYKVSWTLLSKYDLRGVTLEIVIDNFSLDDFKDMYHIFPQKFINVADI